MTENWKAWKPARLQKIILKYVEEHPELSDAPLDKLIDAALTDAGHDPDEVLRAGEMHRLVQWLNTKLNEASKVSNPQAAIPGLPAPALVETGEDERGVTQYTNGQRATVAQVSEHYQKIAEETEQEAAHARHQANSAEYVRKRLTEFGVDVQATAYEDVPSEVVSRLRREL